MWPRIGGLLIPIAFIMAINLVIFVRVLHRLSRRVEGRSLVGKTERRQRLRRCQNAVTILVLMGLTWVVGYLSIIRPASVFVQGIFTVLNSLQGYFIFMLYCVRQPLVRRIWRSQFFCCVPPTKRESKLKPSSKSTSGNMDSNDAAIVRRQKSNHGFNSFSQDMQGVGSDQRRSWSLHLKDYRGEISTMLATVRHFKIFSLYTARPLHKLSP